ncbi:helix-turn-helix domain-containing protein [Streptomyces flavidovirens]|uniref:helix-turn-helix domain-containing protein n=1 Tax=Streptomyces flavidovirens TaxID=67298 RepID=UPI003685C904
MPRKVDPDPDWILDQRRQLGERVRAARLHANYRQERLAHESGVTRLTLQNIEAGTTDARVGWLMRIAHTLGIDVRDLLG